MTDLDYDDSNRIKNSQKEMRTTVNKWYIDFFFLHFFTHSNLNELQDRTYTIMMVDPDYPHHAPGQFYLHWLITNIPGEWLRQGLTYDIGEYIVGELNFNFTSIELILFHGIIFGQATLRPSHQYSLANIDT